jgi:hypothetical protein
MISAPMHFVKSSQCRACELLRGIQNNAQRAEGFHSYLLLILGIAFIGAGIAMLGFASGSLAAVGIGAGFLIADGMISLFIALITRSSKTHLDKKQMTPSLNRWLGLFVQFWAPISVHSNLCKGCG